MSRANPYTQRAIERAIKAALSVGLKVVGVRPDGTVLTDDKPETTTTAPEMPDIPACLDRRKAETA
jgi:hypothetical protein